jgi:succinate dehydrogenase flavin-adding protein (antitoxin of CptAB toxin-antitoxin module)
VDALKSEYEWLLELNDDNLADMVKQTNDVQNALIELLRLVDEIMDVQI